jgi:hypothetical protein
MLYPLSYEGASTQPTCLHVLTRGQVGATVFSAVASADVHTAVTRGRP